MRKAYIQPEIEVLSLASLNDFLNGTDASMPEADGDVNTENQGTGGGDEWEKWNQAGEFYNV